MAEGVSHCAKQVLTPLHYWNAVNSTWCSQIVHSQTFTWLKHSPCIATNKATIRGDDESCLFSNITLLLSNTLSPLKHWNDCSLWEQVGTMLELEVVFSGKLLLFFFLSKCAISLKTSRSFPDGGPNGNFAVVRTINTFIPWQTDNSFFHIISHIPLTNCKLTSEL